LYFVPWGAGTGAPERSEDMAHEAKNAGAAAARVAQLSDDRTEEVLKMNCPALADRSERSLGIAIAPYLGATAALGVGGHSSRSESS
jgi:hypothetical protein